MRDKGFKSEPAIVEDYLARSAIRHTDFWPWHSVVAFCDDLVEALTQLPENQLRTQIIIDTTRNLLEQYATHSASLDKIYRQDRLMVLGTCNELRDEALHYLLAGADTLPEYIELVSKSVGLHDLSDRATKLWRQMPESGTLMGILELVQVIKDARAAPDG